jgi:hypothetical protein
MAEAQGKQKNYKTRCRFEHGFGSGTTDSAVLLIRHGTGKASFQMRCLTSLVNVNPTLIFINIKKASNSVQINKLYFISC